MTMALFLFLVLFGFSVLWPASSTVVVEHTSISFPSVPANFGPAIIDKTGICGGLHVADPLDGCAPLRNRIESNKTEKAKFVVVVVVVVGQCSYDVKVRQAQNAGFRAAIVYDDQPDRKLITMDGNPNGINIPAVYVSKEAGEFLKRYAQVQKGDCCIIPSSPTEKHRKLSIPLIIATFVALAILVIIVLVARRCRSNSHSGEDIGSWTLAPFPNLLMETMTVTELPGFRFRYGTRVNYPETVTCSICLENYNEKEVVAALPCGHEFHAICATRLLRTGDRDRPLCPVCRHDVRIFNEP